MKEGRDFAIIHKINSHFNDLKNDFSHIASFNDFINLEETRRAVLFDFLQMGELTNQLSKKFKREFNNKNAQRLISIRNRIVHGYSTIRDDIIYSTLKNDLTRFMKQLNDFARTYYSGFLKSLIGKRIKVIIDRPVGYKHYDTVYPINYGYTEKMTALDGEFQDVYVLGINEAVSVINGTVVAIIHREEDLEDKLIVLKRKRLISDMEIEQSVSFIEQYFKHHIERN